jgi:hypothetical protein
MSDLDQLLASLGNRPLDPRLATIDDAVFAGLDAARQPVLTGAGLGAIAALAMVVGVMATSLSPAPSYASSPYPLGVPHQLAPSTLLGEVR